MFQLKITHLTYNFLSSNFNSLRHFIWLSSRSILGNQAEVLFFVRCRSRRLLNKRYSEQPHRPSPCSRRFPRRCLFVQCSPSWDCRSRAMSMRVHLLPLAREPALLVSLVPPLAGDLASTRCLLLPELLLPSVLLYLSRLQLLFPHCLVSFQLLSALGKMVNFMKRVELDVLSFSDLFLRLTLPP